MTRQIIFEFWPDKIRCQQRTHWGRQATSQENQMLEWKTKKQRKHYRNCKQNKCKIEGAMSRRCGTRSKTHTIVLEPRRGRRKAAKGSTHLSCAGSMRRSLILDWDRHLTFRTQRAGGGGTTGMVRTHWDPAKLFRKITSSIDRIASHRHSLWFPPGAPLRHRYFSISALKVMLEVLARRFEQKAACFSFFSAHDEHGTAASEKHYGVFINKIWNRMNIEHFCWLEDTWRLPVSRLTDFILLRPNCWA